MLVPFFLFLFLLRNQRIKEYKLRKIKNKANGYYNFKRCRNQCLYAINKVEKPSIEKLKKLGIRDINEQNINSIVSQSVVKNADGFFQHTDKFDSFTE